ncbi:MAG: hypothetical protein HRS57_02765 [Mycoplasmataceae bacterium]|nr:hypothetical protein [Mycoplasmataceae bacterium]
MLKKDGSYFMKSPSTLKKDGSTFEFTYSNRAFYENIERLIRAEINK